MKTYTKEEKREYFKNLRDRWNSVKKSHTEKEISDAQAVIAAHGLNVSGYSFLFTTIQMEKLGLEGIPYLDAKTFQGWKEAGFQVRKGEKSLLSGITWVGVGNKSEDPDEAEKAGDEGYLFPKEYHLFHRSQVEPLA